MPTLVHVYASFTLNYGRIHLPCSVRSLLSHEVAREYPTAHPLCTNMLTTDKCRHVA